MTNLCVLFFSMFSLWLDTLITSKLLETAQLQIEELTRKLRTGDLGIPTNPEERFVSTKVVDKFYYDASGIVHQWSLKHSNSDFLPYHAHFQVL